MHPGLVAARADDAPPTRSPRRGVLVAQTLAFATLLAAALVGALLFTGAENERGAVGMLTGGVADELAERVLSGDPRPIGRPFSLYAVVNAEGYVIATGGAEGERAQGWHLTDLGDEPGARVGGGYSLPLERGGWLVVEIDSRWREGRVLGIALPIALLILGVGAPSFYVLRVLSVRFTRADYRMEPEQVDQMVRERAALLESITDAAIGIDRDGRLLWFNSTAGDLLALTDDDIGANAEELLSAASGGSGGRALEAHLIQIGDRVLMLSTDFDVWHVTGESRLMMLRDYSRDAALLRELDGAQSHIDALRSRGHEFANTLHIIEGLLEMDQPARALDFVRSGGVSGEFGMPADGVEDPSVRALVYAHRARARERGIDLRVAPGAALPDLARADPSFTEVSLLIVGNFLSNAVESCTAGDSVQLMMLAVEASDGSGLVLDFAVDDSGPGVPEHLRDRVFSLGMSTKTGRDARGYGLPIVRGAVTRLGGTCECRTSELGGMRFEARIPIPHSERSRFAND